MGHKRADKLEVREMSGLGGKKDLVQYRIRDGMYSGSGSWKASLGPL